MNIADYLVQAKVGQAPVDYKWDARLRNRILAADADTKPTLAKAIGAVSVRAAFAFAVAASEWVVGRLSTKTDLSDALLRVQAGWAATLDARYAILPLPEDPDDDDDPLVADPLYLAMMLLSQAHKYYLSSNIDRVYMGALKLGMLAEHVAGRNPAFKKWISTVLKSAHKLYPKSTKPVDKQSPIVREVFEADAAPPKEETSHANLLVTLDPSRNRYLVPAVDLQAAGIAKPYPQKG